MFYLYDYVPKTRYEHLNIKEFYRNARKKIWNFKDGDSSSHSFFSEDIINRINNLKTQYPNKEIIIIPIPASTIIKTNNRFKTFLEIICNETKITNGFNYIFNNSDSVAHLGGDRNKKFSLNSNVNINSKAIIILFDDIYTTGTAFEAASSLFSNSIIHGIFLGKTIDGYNIFNFCD